MWRSITTLVISLSVVPTQCGSVWSLWRDPEYEDHGYRQQQGREQHDTHEEASVTLDGQCEAKRDVTSVGTAGVRSRDLFGLHVHDFPLRVVEEFRHVQAPMVSLVLLI